MTVVLFIPFFKSTGVKFTKSGIPVPLDSFGNEMCLLFIKYGRCRFKKKCKKSHWTPPLPGKVVFTPAYQPDVSLSVSFSAHCQISYCEGLGMSPCIMGLTTQDPYIQKEHTELYKILKFVLIGPILNKIQLFKHLKIY